MTTKTNNKTETKTTTSKAAKAKAKPAKNGGNGYPFPTKREIKAKLENDPAYRREALLVLYRRQTEDEQENRETKYKNKRGFMSSHAVNGTNLAIKLQDGEELTPEEEGKLASIVCRYTKQLAADARERMTSENPELVEKTAAFFKPQV